MYVGYLFVFIAACSLQVYAGVAKKGKSVIEDEDYKIVFPGPIQELSTRVGVPDHTTATTNVTDPCQGRDYCTVKPADYPQDLFNSMFKGKYKELAFQPTYILTDDRQGDPDEKDGCITKVTYEPLYQVRDTGGMLRTVVQAAEENYLQMVRIETCEQVGAPCFTEFEAPIDLEAGCKQKTGTWEFLVHDGAKGTEKVKAELPICCSCHYKPIKF